MKGCLTSGVEPYRECEQFCNSLNIYARAGAPPVDLLILVTNLETFNLSKRQLVRVSKYSLLPKVGDPNSSTPSKACKEPSGKIQNEESTLGQKNFQV